MSENRLLTAALRYAQELALPVFPCRVRAKNPATKHGFKDAVTDGAKIADWWSRTPYNIGIATGGGVLVLDVDCHGDDGAETLRELESEHGELPETWTVLTPTGGVHYYFQYEGDDLSIGAGFQPGLDFRYQGGYVIAPPSIHPNGGEYTWDAGRNPTNTTLARLPDWLRDEMKKARKKSADKPTPKAESGGGIEQGRRNDALFRLASSLRAKGLSESAIFAAVSEENRARCVPPLDESEVRRIAQSAAKYAPPPLAPTVSKGLTDFRPERSERYRWSDIGAGNLYADWVKSCARYCPEKKKWFCYDGRVWRPDTGGVKSMQLCKDLADALVKYGVDLPEGTERDAFRKYAEKWQTRRFRENILKDAASVYPVSVSEFDKDPFMFNCQNGTLDLRTFDFRPHNPADMLTLISGVSYDPDARSPLWEKAVDGIFQGNRELILFEQKLFGRCLTGDTTDDRFYIRHGRTTRNGKSTICETQARLLGRGYCRAVAPETIAQRKNVNASAPSEDLARLMGARAMIVSEPDKSTTISAGLIKTLSGGDTLRARNLNESTIEFTPCAKVIINTNWLPRIDDSTVFTSDRVCVIPFDRHFEKIERDTHLKEKLSSPENLSGILNWALDGLRMIYETGFDPPESVLTATDEYWQETDKARRFFAECLTKNPQGEIRSEEVYSKYSAWCTANGQFPESAENFKKNMAPFAICRRKRPFGAGKSANPATLFCGVSWKQEA